MLSLQQGKSVTNYLDKLDTGELQVVHCNLLNDLEAGLVERQGFGLSLFPGG